MCGFLGEVSNGLISLEDFSELLKLSHNRGPDQKGYWSDESVCQIGFNRLAILDTSENAVQPIQSPSNRFVVVCNGEVYNYKDLQNDFHIDSKNLRSTSDTEILAQVLDQCEIGNFPNMLNGMFAIAIYDVKLKLLYLIRDFAGIKPLYYGLQKDIIVFASQFDQIFKHPAFSPHCVLRPDVMKEYFALGYMPAPHTIFKNVFQVEPGQILTYSVEEKKIINKRKYYSWENKQIHSETSATTIDAFESMFNETIKDQLMADVPLASFLSGGIDSPLVNAFAIKHESSLHAYTFKMEGSEMNEAPFASQYAKHLKAAHSIVEMENDNLINSVNEHFKEIPEPHGDYSSLPSYLISKKAKAHATVMLSGDGGDELFWGYPRFLRQITHAGYFRIPFFLRKMLTRVFRMLSNKMLTYALDVNKRFDEWTFQIQSRLNTRELNTLIPHVNLTHSLSELYSYNGDLADKVQLLNWLKWNEFHGHLQRVLRKVDLTSMSNSLEVRVPFLDKRSIEFSNSVISELGSSHSVLKYILRESLSRHIPRNLIMKGKRGFSISIGDMLHNELKDDLIKYCCEYPFYGSEHVNTEFIRQYISDFLLGKHDNEWGVWHFYAWQKWAYYHLLKGIN